MRVTVMRNGFGRQLQDKIIGINFDGAEEAGEITRFLACTLECISLFQKRRDTIEGAEMRWRWAMNRKTTRKNFR